MKINGEFIAREVVGEHILVPVGDTALRFNGVITMNEVGAVIWKGITEGEEEDGLLRRVLDEFDVSEETARKDLTEFLELLKQNELLV